MMRWLPEVAVDLIDQIEREKRLDAWRAERPQPGAERSYIDHAGSLLATRLGGSASKKSAAIMEAVKRGEFSAHEADEPLMTVSPDKVTLNHVVWHKDVNAWVQRMGESRGLAAPPAVFAAFAAAPDDVAVDEKRDHVAGTQVAVVDSPTPPTAETNGSPALDTPTAASSVSPGEIEELLADKKKRRENGVTAANARHRPLKELKALVVVDAKNLNGNSQKRAEDLVVKYASHPVWGTHVNKLKNPERVFREAIEGSVPRAPKTKVP